MSSKRCDGCGEPGAHIRVRQSSGTHQRELWLCDECCRKLGVDQAIPAFGPTVSELLSGLVTRASERACPRCGTEFKEIRRSGRVGCAECYQVFRGSIARLLSQVGAEEAHVGRYPDRLISYKRLLIDRTELRQRLDEAVQREDYEEAALIRDRMLALDTNEDGDE